MQIRDTLLEALRKRLTKTNLSILKFTFSYCKCSINSSEEEEEYVIERKEHTEILQSSDYKTLMVGKDHLQINLRTENSPQPFIPLKEMTTKIQGNISKQLVNTLNTKTMPEPAMQKYTPNIEELLPDYKIQCTQPGCDATFTNAGNYALHLLKHHRVPASENGRQQQIKACNQFHCPIDECIYHEQFEAKGKYFKNMKYLRQHFHKVHVTKAHNCSECNQSFPTIGQLQRHREQMCGRKFKCVTCSWEYTSVESLLTHGKRKGHVVRTEEKKNKKKDLKNKIVFNKEPIPKVAIPRLPPQTQERLTGKRKIPACSTEQPKSFCSKDVQTEDLDYVAPILMDMCTSTNFIDDDDLQDLQSMFCDIETQTEQLTGSQSSSPNYNSVYKDPMMGAAPSTHMYTQTCEDILVELGLAADIQTQTHCHNNCNSSAHDDLFVSTETQTSFNQCLFNCTTAATSTVVESVDVGVSAFGSLSQHTQTCNTLLDDDDDSATFFCGQESELIGTLQSAYTQT